MLDEPTRDRYGTLTLTIAEWGGWWVQVMPMIFNDRVVLTPKAAPMFIDYGWCYPKGAAALLAVRLWNPETEAEPVGYIKAVVKGRRPGERAAGVVV
jgi:hypothetical protein